MLFEYFDVYIRLSLSFRRFRLLLEEEIKGNADRIVINITEVIFYREERKPTRCNNIDGLLSIVDVDY